MSVEYLLSNNLKENKIIDKKMNTYINNNNFKKEKESINMNRIWLQKSSPYFRNIILDIDRYIKNIKHSKFLLYGINKKKTEKKIILTKEEKKDNNKNSLEVQTEKFIIKKNKPEKFAKYKKSIYDRINQIQNETNELLIKDGNSLKNISMNHCRRPRPAEIINLKSEKRMRPTSASTFYESKMFEITTNKTSRNRKLKIKQWSFKSFREETKKRLSQTKDMDIRDVKSDNLKLEKVNDMYRVKINRSIKMFKPIGNLKDMKQIQLYDVNMRKNINNLNEKIKKRIKNRCGGHYFKRQYENYISKNKTKRINEVKSVKNIDNKKILLLKRKSYSTRNLFNRKLSFKKEEISEKEKLKRKKENLKTILDLLKDTLEIEPIHEYINDKLHFRNRINKDINKDKKKYFSNLDEISKKFDEINKEKDIQSLDDNFRNIIKTKEKLSKDIVHHSLFNKDDNLIIKDINI